MVGREPLLVLGVGSLVRQQLAPSRYKKPSIPERFQVADDLCRPLAEVVAVAEQEVITGFGLIRAASKQAR